MDTPLAPKVSIMMCTYNRAPLIKEAIMSALNQTFSDFELLILDDASTDTTAKIVHSFQDSRIRYIKNATRQDIAKNRNRGLAEARGNYIAILDSDDKWSDNEKLASQIRFLETHPDVAVVGTFAHTINETGQRNGDIRPETDPLRIKRNLLLRNNLINSSSLFHKHLAVLAGGYDDTLSGIEDYDLWLKLGRSHKLANLPLFMTDYRIHGGQVTKRRLRLAIAHFRLVKRYRRDYPNFLAAYIKSILRIIRSALFIW